MDAYGGVDVRVLFGEGDGGLTACDIAADDDGGLEARRAHPAHHLRQIGVVRVKL